jgi:hypothetical protein
MKKKFKLLVTVASLIVVSASVPTVALTASKAQATVSNNEAIETATISNSNFFNLSNIRSAVTAVQNVVTTAQNVVTTAQNVMGNLQGVARTQATTPVAPAVIATSLDTMTSATTYKTASPYTTKRFLVDGDNSRSSWSLINSPPLPKAVLPSVAPGKMNVMMRFSSNYLQDMTVKNLDLSLEKYPYAGFATTKSSYTYEEWLAFDGIKYLPTLKNQPNNKGELDKYYQEIALDVTPGEKVTDSFIGNLFQFKDNGTELKRIRWMDQRTGFEVTTFSEEDVGKTILLVPMVPKNVRVSVDGVVVTTLPMSEISGKQLSKVPGLSNYLNIPFDSNFWTPGLKTYYYDSYTQNLPMLENPICPKNILSINGSQQFPKSVEWGLPIIRGAMYSPHNNTGSEITKNRPLLISSSNNSSTSNKIGFADTFELNLRTVR